MQKTVTSTFTQVFVAPSGRAIAYHYKEQGGCQGVTIYTVEPSFSPDGRAFHQLLRTGIMTESGETNHESWILQCPGLDIAGRVHRSMDTLSFNNELYVLDETVPEVSEIVPLPEVRVKEGFYRTAKGGYCYLSHDLFGDADASLRLYVGVVGDMRRVTIEQIERFRRGGRIVVTSSEGEFHAPFRPGHAPTWAGEELTTVNPKDFVITETDEGLMIMPRQVIPGSWVWWQRLFQR